MLHAWSLPETGDIVGGKYRIERVLGTGGMGAVFEATHLVTNRRFALKWLLPEGASREASIKRFIREAKVAGHCQHRNIVQVYDINREQNAMFMVMELLVGESLADRLARTGRLNAREACRVLLPCLDAVAAANAVGIVHRDIKPGNIYLCAADGGEPESAKVLDFGVACFLGPHGGLDFTQTNSGAVVGTPYYMAPEQMRGRAVDPRVDVYSLGVTLYEVLSSQRPFHATSYAELVLQITNATPTPLEALTPELPNGLGTIVRRAMARDPEARFSSVNALAEALAPYRERPDFQPSTRRDHFAETPLAAEMHERKPLRAQRAWLRPAIALPLMAAVVLGAAAFAWDMHHNEPSAAVHVAEAPIPEIKPQPAPVHPKPANTPALTLVPEPAAVSPAAVTSVVPNKVKHSTHARSSAHPQPMAATTRPAPDTREREDQVLDSSHLPASTRATVSLDRSEF